MADNDETQSTLTAQVQQALANVRSDRPLTGIAAAGWTVMAMGFTAIAGLMLAVTFGVVGALITSSVVGGGVGAIVGLGLSLLIPARPNRDWRKRLTNEGMDVRRVRRATEVELPVEGDVRVFYRLTPGDRAVESLRIRCVPALSRTLRVQARALRLGAPAFDDGLMLDGPPDEQACVTAPLRAALARMDRPIVIEHGSARIPLSRGQFELPDGALDALAAALHQLAVDLTDVPTALKRICQAAPFDAARALVVTAEPHLIVQERSALREIVLGSRNGEPDRIFEAGLSVDDRIAAVRGVFRIGGVLKNGFAPLVFAANQLPDTEAGCMEAAGILGALESLAAPAKFKRLGEIGTLAAARWLGESQFPLAHGIQTAADAARAAIHARLQVHGALSMQTANAAGAMTIVEGGQLSAPPDDDAR